jgi:NADPH:quinone reductase-like Zn-dependent oxidoreductase
MMGLTKPRSDRLGADFAGIVVAVGEGVEHLKADDEVFGDVSSQGFGSYAEYLLAEAESVVVKPVSLTFEQAAAVPMAASTALEGVRDVAQIAAGQRVLVNGASGGVGSFAVQLAKHYGAEVHAVCHSQKTDMVERLGAGRVIAYDKEDVTRGDTHYDVILDAAACRSFRAYRRILHPSGVYVLVGGAMMPLLEVATVGRIVSLFSKQRFRNYLSMPKREKLMSVKELIEAGEIEPAVDRTFALDQVPDALRYFESRQVRGKVVISV